MLFSVILVETLQKFSHRKYSTLLLDRDSITLRPHCTLLDFTVLRILGDTHSKYHGLHHLIISIS
jgi:hypothetical protein